MEESVKLCTSGPRVWVCMEERVKLCTSGPRVWLRWHKEIDVCADLGYFILTTLSGTYS